MSTQIVVPMAGAGSRFARAGHVGSKPLLDVGGTPMFMRALSSLGRLQRDPVTTYVVRQQQVDEERIDERVRHHDPDARIVVLPSMTSGAAETAAAAMPSLRSGDPVVVLDCDLWFFSPEYDEAVDALGCTDGQDAVLLTFAATDPRYSYVETDEVGRAVRVAEKRVISDRAIAGSYAFRAAGDFSAAVDRVLARGLSDDVAELYMSEVLRDLLARGARVQVTAVQDYSSFGTPEELAESLKALA